jgi:hypothetical protein
MSDCGGNFSRSVLAVALRPVLDPQQSLELALQHLVVKKDVENRQ